MAKRIIRRQGDEILQKKAKVVKEITPAVLTLLDDMAETMEAADGVGLAAPQVGVLKRIVTIDVGDGVIEMINPEIIEKKGTQRGKEGCLSVPGMTGYVDRPAYVKVQAMDRHGETFEMEATELLAVAVCHETDHLEGLLFIQQESFEEFVEDAEEPAEDAEE